MAPKDSKAQVLILYELPQIVLGAVRGLRIIVGRGSSSHTSVAVGARCAHQLVLKEKSPR